MKKLMFVVIAVVVVILFVVTYERPKLIVDDYKITSSEIHGEVVMTEEAKELLEKYR